MDLHVDDRMPNLRAEGSTASNHAVIAEQVLVIIFLFFFFDIVEYNSVRDVGEIANHARQTLLYSNGARVWEPTKI